MYKDDPVFEKPDDVNANFWRYMDFTKFISLLDKAALFFVRADKLGDPFEGSYSKANSKLRLVVNGDEIPEEEPRSLSAFFKAIRSHIAINCWHLNEYESVAMWKLYLNSNEGIAIQSTFSRLRDSFKGEGHDIRIGKVKYIDYEKDWLPEGSVFSPFIHKRKSFEHEREYRAVLLGFSRDSRDKSDIIALSETPFADGTYVPVDLDILIEKIYLAPTCPNWLLELVKSVIRKYGLDKEVVRSSLDDKPVY